MKTITAHLLAATLLMGAAVALPPHFPAGVGPTAPHSGIEPSSCSVAQAFGSGGGSGGTTTDYHRYANEKAIGALDGCVGTGADGEFEYGSASALLPVRLGASGDGAGVATCIGPLATAHHGADDTLFVQDVLAGGSVGFTVAADWGYDAGRPCGDGIIEPCPPGGQPGVIVLLATNSSTLQDDLVALLGCNPLDVVARHHALPAGSAGPNAWTPGFDLSAFGDGGAAGYLLVTLDVGSEATVEYDLLAPWGQEVTIGSPTDVSAPTAGWIWTG